MSRPQIKFTFQIGYAFHAVAFEKDIAKAASVHCGGCTTSHKVGWWCADGATKGKTSFDTPAEQEHCLEVEVTCEAHKAESVYRKMKTAIALAAVNHNIATNWVHVSEVAMTGRHFSIEEMTTISA